MIPGVVVSAPAFRSFLETIQWADPLFRDLPNSSLHIDVDNPRQLQAIAQQIRQGVTTTPIAQDWLAVLEAAIATWQSRAVILRPSIAVEADVLTRLEYPRGVLRAQVCWAEPGAIAKGVQQVWGELFRAKSLLYWQRLGVQLQQVNLAVLIQPLESAIASGTLQGNASGLEIQSIWGLGNALVEGIVAADSYQGELTGEWCSVRLGTKRYAYDLSSPATLSVIGGEALPASSPNECLRLYPVAEEYQQQAALSDRQRQHLLQLAQHLIQEYGQPVCLEWALHPGVTGAEPSVLLTQIHPCLVQKHQSTQDPAVAIASATASLLPEGCSQLHDSTSAYSTSSDVSHSILHGVAAASGQVLAQAWVIDHGQALERMPSNAVLVASHIQPQWVAALKQCAGIVTEQGGATSHGAILAREIGIPAVVGVADVTQQIQSGEIVFVDGDGGKVYRVNALDAGAFSIPATAVSAVYPSEMPVSQPSSAMPVAIATPLTTQLMVNLSQLQRLADVAAMSVDGVGLLRSELMMQEVLSGSPQQWLLNQTDVDLIERLSQQIQRFAEAFAPRPVFYRSLDLRSHEIPVNAHMALTEPNPTLGLHGALSYQTNPALFELELAALRRVQARGYDNLRLILPFVRTVEEFEFCRDRVIEAGLTQTSTFELWIMAEVPSVLFLIPEYVDAGVQGISIGSNDLTQLMLAVDRDHPQMTGAFDQCHPALIRAMQHLIQAAKQAGIPCSICGQAPVQHPELIEQLVEWGITAISVSADAIESTRRAIAEAEERKNEERREKKEK